MTQQAETRGAAAQRDRDQPGEACWWRSTAIFQDAYFAPLKPDSEIYLIPKIGGG